MIHSSTRIGKLFLINTSKEVIKRNNKSTILAYPTRSTVTILNRGQTFHKVFYLKDRNNTKEGAIASRLRKDSLRDNVDLIVINEVLMISARYLVLLNSRLRLICNDSKIFRGKYILLSSDYS